MIRIEDLSVRVGGFALANLSLEVPPGGYGLVIGPTGAGKTTLLDAIAGHVVSSGGRVMLDGRDVTRTPPEARHVGFVYQSYQLFPHFTVAENIGYGLARAGLPPDQARTRVAELAELLSLGHLLTRGVRGLSGGEQQRVALARALAPRPRILLLDEPFAAVDPAIRRVLRRQLIELREREGVTTLHVTHDVDDALRLGDVVAVLSAGEIVQAGPPEQVFRFPSSPFVAQFVGAGTVLRGNVVRLDPPEGSPPRFRGRFTSGDFAVEVVAERTGEAHALIRPEDLVLSRETLPGPPRNRFQGGIERLERLGPIVNVHLVAHGVTLMATVTSATADDLELRKGARVAVALKATSVHLF